MSTIDVLSSETREVVYSLPATARVFRFEPRGAETPMTPHTSPYAPYGWYEFGYDHLFVVEESALSALKQLRAGQGYFEQDVVLRSATLGDLLERCGADTVVLEDIKFNFTVLGSNRKGALIITVPKGRGVRV